MSDKVADFNKRKILEDFQSLSVWRQAGQRAPHKPLLCLLAISAMVNENMRLISYEKIEPRLIQLLKDFGPPRKLYHPEYPFWCLQSEGIWKVRAKPSLSNFKGIPTRSILLHNHAEGALESDMYSALDTDEEFRNHVIRSLLQSHFPETLQEDILRSLNLEIDGTLSRRKERDSQFRETILAAYEYRCAVCGFNVRVGHAIVALDAAHIKWYQAGGPDVRENGLALCSLHHRLFDRGAFTLDKTHQIIVSERAYGTGGFDEHLGRFHRKDALKPVRKSYLPRSEFLFWHAQQVFLSPERE